MRWFSGLDCGIPVHIAATPLSIAASPYGSVSPSLSDSRSNGRSEEFVHTLAKIFFLISFYIPENMYLCRY